MSGMVTMPKRTVHGFRVDPMPWAAKDQSIEAASIRKLVLEDPQPDDESQVRAELERIRVFEPREPSASDGGPAQPSHSVNAENLLRLTQLGATEEHPEIHKALALLDQLPHKPRQPIGGDALHALCLLGRADHPAIRHSIRLQIESAPNWIRPRSGCPWTPSGSLPGLWAARELEDTAPIVEQGLQGILDEIHDSGTLDFMDPWSFVRCAAFIDLPVAREILITQIPMILRAQNPDGGWERRSLDVLRALKIHGLLEVLRGLPPLPPDWRVVRAIPGPEGDSWGLTWDGRRLWVGVRDNNEAVALSTDDGQALARVSLPEGHGRWLGWWNGRLAVTQGSNQPNAAHSNRLLQIDPDSGRVTAELPLDRLEWVGGVMQLGGELWVFDSFFGAEYVLDASHPKPIRETHDDSNLPCSPMAASAAEDGSMWCVDVWSPWTFKLSRDHQLLDWAERPFGSYAPVVWDGTQLWAQDRANRRLCVVERTGVGLG